MNRSPAIEAELEATLARFTESVHEILARQRAENAEGGPGDTEARKRSRRTRRAIVEQALAIAVLIGKHPEGVKAGALSAESGIPKNRIGVPLHMVTANGFARQVGTKGGAKYLPS